jgi:hypothetical protein
MSDSKHPSLVRGLILEGIGAAGKTSTLKAIKQTLLNDPEAERSLVALSEAYTQILNVIDGQHVHLNRLEHLALLEKQVTMFEGLNDSVRPQGAQTRRSRGLMFLLERVHLSHRAAFHAEENFEVGIAALETRLNRLGGKCVLLTVSQAQLENRAIVRRGLQFEFAATRDAYLEQNVGWQEQLKAQMRNSSVPTLEINTDDMDWDGVAGLALNFLGR